MTAFALVHCVVAPFLLLRDRARAAAAEGDREQPAANRPKPSATPCASAIHGRSPRRKGENLLGSLSVFAGDQVDLSLLARLTSGAVDKVGTEA